MTRATAKLLLGSFFGLVLAGAVADIAEARPGGGHSYSGGGSRSSGGSYRSSSSSSGGGGGSTTDAVAVLVGMVGFMVVVGLVSSAAEKKESAEWRSSATKPAWTAEVDALRAHDPAFSQVAFEDFAFNLFARAQRARGNPAELEALTPYFTSNVLQELANANPVSHVVIGSLRIIVVTAPVGSVNNTVGVRIEANLGNPSGTFNVIELWSFAREAAVQSRVPEKTRTFPCPNCGAPFKRGSAERTCAHCNTAIEAARFDWTVIHRDVGAQTSVGVTLTGTTVEVGNDLTTIVAPDAFPQVQALYEADRNVTWDAFAGHVTLIYQRLNEAWNAQNLTPVRGLVTHSLLGYLQFWVDEYKRQGLANHLVDARIARIALAKVQRDPYFDAITVRVFADGNDYTVDRSGAVVGGSKTSRRAYTEYWTLIRSASRKGPVVNELKCPNCGAPLAISDAGDCTHCNAHVENGSFDWVLSKIEQDEVYTG